ncbi:MAG: DUF1376 domain-containing protein [Pandoraea sp.]|uniref:YdaU family protein n=1 Tax=Pandoraea sp. TaxID=1883445 RepID=UPI0012122874|nr:YdaU family protein [Pandoraea sp.]TAM15949.1 MAG: DUF1376 domain-containing protein [Pandoraea sp.]
MNYYEHHIGDYDEATSHLTACEDGIYNRLIRKYYSTEKPLPNDIPALQRLVRARTREEKSAVIAILEEFFSLEEDGWHQKRCDEDLEKFLANEPERELKKANEDNRLKRHREERARLFKSLTDAGLHAPWNIGMGELRQMVAGISATQPETAPETDLPPLPATAPATPATATQTPDARHQTPDIKPEDRTDVGGPPPARAENRIRPSDLSSAMRRHSIEAQPGDPRIIAAAESGISVETIEAACAEAKASDPKGRIKPGFVIAIAQRWTADASRPTPRARASPNPAPSYHDERKETIAQLTGRKPAHRPTQHPDGVIDVDADDTPRRLGP